MSKGKKTIEEQIKEAEQYFINGKLSKALNILEPLSGQGQARVEYLLSLIYEYGGDGIKSDMLKAVTYLSTVTLKDYFAVRFINLMYLKKPAKMAEFNEINQTVIKVLSTLEQSTDPFIQLEIGLYYSKDFTGVTDMDKAIKYLTLSAKQGVWIASFNLGCIYLYIKKDFELARTSLIDAAEKGMAEAAHVVGCMYYQGSVIKQDYELAKHYLEIGAKQNHSICTYNLAMCCQDSGDTDSAIYWLKKNVEVNDDLKSAADLGVLYALKGDLQSTLKIAEQLFNKKDDGAYEKAVGLFQLVLSKDDKNTTALYYMGMIYISINNIDKGRDCWKRAVEYGGSDDYYADQSQSMLKVLNLDNPKPKENKTESNADKLKNLKKIFAKSYDYNKIFQAYDPEKTIKDIYIDNVNFDTMLRDYSNVIEKATELDCDITEDKDLNNYVEELKKILYNLRGDSAFKDINATWKADLKAANKALLTEEKPKRAMELFQKAANAGSGEAMYQLGQMYMHFWSPCSTAELEAEMSGKPKNDKCHPVEKDINKAIEYYKKAAALDYTEAMTSLAFIYKEGKYVTQDLNETVKLYRQAALLGNSSAMSILCLMYKEGDGVPQNETEANFYRRMHTFDDYLECHNQLKEAFDPNTADQLMPLFAQNTEVAQPQSEAVTSTEVAEINTSEEDKKNEGLALFMLIATAVLYFVTSLGFFKSIFYAFIATCILVLVGKDK